MSHEDTTDGPKLSPDSPKLSPADTKEISLKAWMSQVLFLISLITVVAGFFTWIDNKNEKAEARMEMFQQSVNKSFDKLSTDMKADYATKEEMRFMKDVIIEIKGDIKETKGKLEGSLATGRRGNN